MCVICAFLTMEWLQLKADAVAIGFDVLATVDCNLTVEDADAAWALANAVEEAIDRHERLFHPQGSIAL